MLGALEQGHPHDHQGIFGVEKTELATLKLMKGLPFGTMVKVA
jgi:hypothetical protein